MRVPERAAEVAQLHADKIANLIHVVGNQQVQLEVKFAEVSRNGLRELGLNVFHQDAGGRFVGGHDGAVGPRRISSSTVPGTGTAAKPPVQSPALGGGFSLFFSGLPNFPFSAILTALEVERARQDARRADAGRAVGAGGEVPGRRRVPDPDLDAASAPCRSSGRSSASS